MKILKSTLKFMWKAYSSAIKIGLIIIIAPYLIPFFLIPKKKK